MMMIMLFVMSLPAQQLSFVLTLSDFKMDFVPSDSRGDPARDRAHSPLRAPDGAVLLRDLGRRRLAGDGGLEGQRLGHQSEDAGETTQNVSAQRSRTKRFL